VSIPDYQDIMLPLLKLTGDGKVHTIRGLKDAAADEFQLTEEERDQLLPSGQQTTFHNRLSWAKHYLLNAGLLEKTRRGHFIISSRGREVLSNPPQRIDSDYLSRFAEFLEFKGRSNTNGGGATETSTEEIDERRTPEEVLQAGDRSIQRILRGMIA
jgi:restriction system protein